MIKQRLRIIKSNKFKTILLLGAYVVLTELIKTKAEVYVIEQSLELKLLLFLLVIVLLYEVSYNVIVVSLIVLLLLSIFNIPTGLMVYVLILYAFVKLLKKVRQASFS